MKIRMMAFGVTFLAANAAFALEFQPIGSIGMGGAGVARTFDGAAAYWNPGALAFEADKTSIKVGSGVGYQIDNNLAGNVDRLSTLGDPTTDLSLNGTTSSNLAAAGQIAQILGVMNDIAQHGNDSIRLDGNAFVGVRVGHFGTGVFGGLAGAGTPRTDLTNIKPTGGTTAADLAAAINPTATTGTPTFFSAQQFAAIASAFGGGTTGSSIAFAFDQQLAASNTAKVSASSAAGGLIQLGNAIAPGSTAGDFSTNQSSLQTRGIAYFELPLAYGYPIDLGRFGTLGIGGSVKAMAGRVYISSSKLFTTTSGDIFSNITKNHEDSLTWGIDLGALWKWRIVNVGIVAKNLNTPKFSTDELVTTEDGFRIRPQVRGGAAVDLLSWLTAAADLDLTKNATTQLGVKSQNVGGGLELHPAEWFKLRMGAYKNLAASGFGSVVTAGLTLGPKWLNMDLDAAASPETGEYKGHSYPREGKAQLSLNSTF